MTISDFGHWTCDIGVPEEPYGFIYEITTPSGKKYIGKKQMVTKLKRKPLKGKKRKRISIVETDWRKYTSSSNIINEEIEKNGKDGFTFKILRFVFSKFEAAYGEAKIQFEKNVLFDETYLNGIINLRLSRAPKELQERFSRGEFT